MWRRVLILASACCLGLLPVANAQITATPIREILTDGVAGDAQVLSASNFAQEPASGVVSTSALMLPLNRLGLTDLDMNVLTDFPLGLAEITLAKRAVLVVEGQDAYGRVVLDVTLPSTEATYRVGADAHISFAPIPLVELAFEVEPGVSWLDPLYAFSVLAPFDGQAVS